MKKILLGLLLLLSVSSFGQILLTNTTHTIEAVTTTGGDIDYEINYSDETSSGVGIYSVSRGAITTATTTTVLAAPASSTTRIVDRMSFRNIDVIDETVTVKVDVSGTETFISIPFTLTPNDHLEYLKGNGWTLYSATGAATSNVQVFTSSGNYNKPTNFNPTTLHIFLWGAGGGGGAGASLATATVAKGGGGGGGGSCIIREILASDVTSAVTVTLGNGGTAGAPGAAGAAGGDGGTGQSSTFGAYFTAFGGGGGRGGAISNAVTGGGGGGGVAGAGAVGTTSGGAGGLPTAASNGLSEQGVTGGVATATSQNSHFGGAGGAGINTTPTAGAVGGSSFYGGGGGGVGMNPGLGGAGGVGGQGYCIVITN